MLPMCLNLEDTGLQDGVEIDVTILESTLHQYDYMKCNYNCNPPLMNGKT